MLRTLIEIAFPGLFEAIGKKKGIVPSPFADSLRLVQSPSSCDLGESVLARVLSCFSRVLRSRGSLATAASVLVVILVLGGCGEDAGVVVQQTAPTPEKTALTEEDARNLVIDTERRRLLDELVSYGGWTGWYTSLQPFREDMLALVKAAREKQADAKIVEGSMGHLAPLEGVVRQCGDLDALGKSDGEAATEWSSVSTCVDLSNQLWARGIDLIVVPIPAKFELYPEAFSESPPDVPTTLVRHRYMVALLELGVEVLDLYPAMSEAKKEGPVCLLTDSHWNDRAMGVASTLIAERLQRYAVVRERERIEYAVEDVVYRHRSPLVKGFVSSDEQDDYAEVSDPGIRVIDITGEPYDYANNPYSPVLLFGDSYMMNKRAGGTFAAHLAKELGMPVSALFQFFVTRDGVRALARKGKDYLDGRRVVVWFMNSRGFATEWRPAKLP